MNISPAGVPAAVFLAEVLGDIGHVEQLVGIEVRVVVGRQDHVRPGAGVGGDSSLRAHVFPAFVVDADFDAGLLGELLDVGHVGIDVALHEAAPAQHAQLGALLRLECERLRAGRGAEQRAADADRCGGSHAGRSFDESAAVEFGHSGLLQDGTGRQMREQVESHGSTLASGSGEQALPAARIEQVRRAADRAADGSWCRARSRSARGTPPTAPRPRNGRRRRCPSRSAPSRRRATECRRSPRASGVRAGCRRPPPARRCRRRAAARRAGFHRSARPAARPLGGARCRAGKSSPASR